VRALRDHAAITAFMLSATRQLMEPDSAHTTDPVRQRVEGWVRETLGPACAASIRVRERPCDLSGWPPFETVISVATVGGTHEHVIHKRTAQVTRLDVAAVWRAPDSCCGP
jgi:hypothetical protein